MEKGFKDKSYVLPARGGGAKVERGFASLGRSTKGKDVVGEMKLMEGMILDPK